MRKRNIVSLLLACILVLSGVLSTPMVHGSEKETMIHGANTGKEERGTAVDSPSSILSETSSSVIESLSILKSQVAYGEYQKIEVRMKDNGYHLTKMYMTVQNEKGETRDYILQPEDITEPGYEGPIVFLHEELISFLMGTGTYKVVSYEVVGNMNGQEFSEKNDLPYSGTTHVMSKGSFHVLPNNFEASLSVSDTSFEVGDRVTMKMTFNTPDIIDNDISLTFRVNSKYGHNSFDVKLRRISASVFEGTYVVSPNMMAGTATLKSVSFQQSVADLEYQELPFTLNNKGVIIQIDTFDNPSNSTEITKTELLTPVITVGEDIKLRFTFGKAMDIYEVETSYSFIEGFNYVLKSIQPVKVSGNQYELTVPSHYMHLMEIKDQYEYTLNFSIHCMDGTTYFPESQKVIVNRDNKRMVSFAQSSVKDTEITVEGDGEFYLKYDKDVEVGEIEVTFFGDLTNSTKRIILDEKNLDPSLSDSMYDVYKGVFPIEAYEKERRWRAEYFLTYFDTGFRLKQADYDHFSMWEQVSREDLSHFRFNVTRANENAVTRIEGANRYETAVRVSRKSFQQAEHAILVSGMDFPDALAAGPIAHTFNAPILLAQKDRLNSSTKEELFRLGVRKVFILGGENVISKEVESILEEMGIEHERVAGSNRYGTAIDVARRFAPSKTIEKVVLTSAMEYADSLSIGSYAARNGLPILLTPANGIRDDLKIALETFGTKEVVIMGGLAAVSQDIENELNALGITTERISGANRYLTAMESAKTFFASSEKAIVASGENFADALAAVPYAAKNNAPIILVRKGSISRTVKNHLNTTGIRNYEIIGGSAAVNSFVEYSITNARYE